MYINMSVGAGVLCRKPGAEKRVRKRPNQRKGNGQPGECGVERECESSYGGEGRGSPLTGPYLFWDRFPPVRSRRVADGGVADWSARPFAPPNGAVSEAAGV